MSKKTRTPSQPDPRPQSPEPQGDNAQNPDASSDSLYRFSLGSTALKRIAEARKIDGIDDEIAILRVRLDKLLLQERKYSKPESKGEPKIKYDIQILKAIDLIIRAYAAKARSSGDSDAPSQKGIENILRDASRKFGLKTIPWSSSR